jgi:eukaryotic-like serine/threonine-protein kinase
MLALMHFATGRPKLAAESAEKAYALRERVGEYEKLRLTARYHFMVSGDVDKMIEALTLQKRLYPRAASGYNDLALAYNFIGQSEQAATEARESIQLIPIFAASYKNLALALLRLNRFAEAKEAITQALQQKLDMTDFHAYLYQLAFIQSPGGATAGMQQQLDWAKGKPDEYVALNWQTGAAAFAGQWRKAQDFARRAIDLAVRSDTQEVAARYATEQALQGALFGDCRQAKVDVAQGLQLARSRAALPRAALALALCGEAKQAKPLTDELTKLYPEDTLINELWLPAIKAAITLQRGNATQAIEQLQTAARYESAAEFWPQYLRGQAYLQLRRGAEATTEFQKILAERGQAPLSVLYPLAQLGLARAAALASDAARSRQAYQAFFSLWQEAEAELPLLRAARREAGALAQ